MSQNELDSKYIKSDFRTRALGHNLQNASFIIKLHMIFWYFYQKFLESKCTLFDANKS